MNRLDELTIQLADHGLSDAEQVELDSLLADESARRRHCELLELEAALTALREAPSIAAETLAGIQKQSSDDLERSVMRAIAELPAPNSRERRWPRVGLLILGAALSAVCLVVLAFSRGWFVPEAAQPAASSSPNNVAVLVDGSPDLRIDSDTGEAVVPRIGAPLPVGKTLTTLRDGWAVLQFADGSRLSLFSESQMKLESLNGHGKQVRLLSGYLRADLTQQPQDRPLVITTPHTRFQAAATHASVAALVDQGTRIDLDEGHAELVGHDGSPMALDSGSSAFVPADHQPVVVKRQTMALTVPQRELSFRGLRMLSSFGLDPTVLGVNWWQAVYWHGDDRIEALPVSKQGRKGVRIEQLSGPMVAYREKSRDRLFVWDARNEKLLKRVRLKSRNLFVTAVSPAGDWVGLVYSPGDQRKVLHLLRWNGRKSLTFPGKQIISSMASSPDGRILAVGRRRIGNSKGNAVDLIDCHTGKQIGRLDVQFSHPITLAFSGDGKRLAVGLTGRLQVWDIERQKRVCMIEQPGCAMVRVALSADGNTVAGTSQGDRVWIWDVATQRERYVIRPGEQTRGLLFHATSGRLTILTKDGRLTDWTLPSEMPGGDSETAL